MLPLTAYLLAGVLVFFGLRLGFRKAKIDPKAHDKIWISWVHVPEAWLFAIPCWPVLAAASIAWFAAELLHASGKKEMQRREEAEAKRDKRYDHLTLDQKIDLLKTEVQKQK